MTIVEKAKKYATAAHASISQLRKYTNEPYIVHPAEVVRIVMSVPHSEAMLAAAWLHDTVEDVFVAAQGLPREEGIEIIRAEFGDEVADIVDGLTDVSRKEDGNRATRKAIDRAHSGDAPAEVHTVKLADLISNSKSILEHDANFAVTYLAEKALLLEVLTKGDPTLHAQATAILKQGQEELLQRALSGEK